MLDASYKGRTVFNAAPQLDYEAVSWEQPTQAELDVFRRAIETHKQAHRDRVNALLDKQREVRYA